MCECVRETEGERKRDRDRESGVCVRVCVCVRERERENMRLVIQGIHIIGARFRAGVPFPLTKPLA